MARDDDFFADYARYRDEIDGMAVIAHRLHLTPAQHCHVTGRYFDPTLARNKLPTPYLGGMFLKVLRDQVPTTAPGRLYSAEEISFFWERARQLAVALKPKLRAKLQARTPDKELGEAVRNWAGRRSVFTVTGRLRANATFCSSRIRCEQAAQRAVSQCICSSLWSRDAQANAAVGPQAGRHQQLAGFLGHLRPAARLPLLANRSGLP